MGKNGLIALLLALLLAASAVLPACAAGTDGRESGREDDYGGLTAEEIGETGRPAEEEGLGPESGAPKRNTRPVRDGGEDGEDSEDGEDGGAPSLSSAGKRKQKIGAGQSSAPAGVSLMTDSHIAYASGSGGAFPSFYPYREVTRAEAAVMLCRLLPSGIPVPDAEYADVPEDAWYASAVKTLAGLGVMEAEDGLLDSGKAVTRGEFIRYIACFFPLRSDAVLFDDVSWEDPNAPYIISARAYGWAQGDDSGRFRPDDPVSRAAAVVLLNRALGRTADREYIDLHQPAFFVDLDPLSWYYYDVLEAAVAHEHGGAGEMEFWISHTARAEVPPDGFQLVDGWLYCYDSARGGLVRNDTVQNHDFNRLGRFTTGNEELDSWLHKIVATHTNSSMTQEEMLRALFLYTRDSFTYLRRPPYAFGVYDYMETDALRILNTGYGNCYCYASLLWYLTRWIGYDSVIYNGTVGVRKSPHSWVEINMDGKNYIFDAELEMAYRRKKRFDINLYKFYDPSNSWNYVRPES